MRSVACVLLGLVAGCGPDVEPRLSDIEEKIFAPNCSTSSCHSGTGLAGGLELTKGRSHAQLVGVAAGNVGAKEDGLLRVKPGDPGASFLVVKLRERVDVRYGTRMPQAGPALDAELVEVVEEWIRLGAKDD